MISICSMVHYPPVVDIHASGICSIISNGDGNIHPISEKDIIIYFPSIGDKFHAYIENWFQKILYT